MSDKETFIGIARVRGLEREGDNVRAEQRERGAVVEEYWSGTCSLGPSDKQKQLSRNGND